jgi:hypothetical protein
MARAWRSALKDHWGDRIFAFADMVLQPIWDQPRQLRRKRQVRAQGGEDNNKEDS